MRTILSVTASDLSKEAGDQAYRDLNDEIADFIKNISNLQYIDIKYVQTPKSQGWIASVELRTDRLI
jgi:hypothetical protein